MSLDKKSRIPHVDIAIVGAGLAGSALAVALTTDEFIESTGKRLNIALIEAAEAAEEFPPVDGGLQSYDLRASALTHNTIQWLEQIGIWPDVAAIRTGSFDGMQVWVEEGTGSIEFSAQDASVDRLGEVVENRLLVATLQSQLRQREYCRVYNGAGVVAMEALPSTASQPFTANRLSLEGGQQLDADLIVAADGGRSVMRELIDMPVREWDYGHDALVCNVRMEKAHNHVAIQRFTRTGPVAFLPLGVNKDDASLDSKDRDKLCTIVWSQIRSHSNELMKVDDDTFAHELAASIENRLGRVEDMSGRVTFPLWQRHAKNYVKQGVVLVADAAHTIHPLAGQGINLGLMDVAALTKAIAQSLGKYGVVSHNKMLRRFQRERKTSNLAMMAAMEGFKWIYQPKPLPLTLLRNQGMNFLDYHSVIKGQLVRYALGPQ